MLTISESQMARLGQAQLARFVDDCVQAARTQLAQETEAEATESLRTRVRDLVARLQSVGFRDSSDIAQAIALILKFQFLPGKPAMPASLAAELRSPSVSVEKKIEALEQLFLFEA